MRVYFYNNIYPSRELPNIAAYSKTLFDLIGRTGIEAVNYSYIKEGMGRGRYMVFLLKLLLMKLPSKDDLLYINHYTHLLPLVLKFYFAKRKVVYHWHGEELASDRLMAKVLRAIAKPSLMKNSVHISPSRYYKAIIRAKLGVPEEQILVSPSGGVNMELFHERLYPSDDIICIGFPAALCEHKGIGFLYSLLECNDTIERRIGKKIVYKVIDYGADAEPFKKYVRQNGMNNVRIYPRYNHDNLSSFYADVHLTLFLSKRESLGLTVLESMACGVPVLARSVSSMPEMVVPHVTGELVPAKPTIEEIISGIGQMVKHGKKYRPRLMVEEKYSQEQVVEQYKQIFNKFQTNEIE